MRLAPVSIERRQPMLQREHTAGEFVVYDFLSHIELEYKELYPNMVT